MSEEVKGDIKDYKVGTVTQGSKDLARYYQFSLKQMLFLKEYSKHLDADLAAKAVDVKERTVKKWLQTEAMRAEIMEIHSWWRWDIRMTSEAASSKHLKLMEKFEKDYNSLDLGDKPKMATPLAKMSDIYMRATNSYKNDDTSASNIIINIDLGGDPENEKKVKISGNKDDSS